MRLTPLILLIPLPPPQPPFKLLFCLYNPNPPVPPPLQEITLFSLEDIVLKVNTVSVAGITL